MIYDASLGFYQEKALKRLEWLIDNKRKFEIREIVPIRTLAQNRYLHLILSWFAFEYGETLEYVKVEFFKKIVNPDLFKVEYANPVTGEVREALRSSKDLDKSEMTLAIDKFRDWASKEAGIYLPDAKDLDSVRSLEMELLRNNIKSN